MSDNESITGEELIEFDEDVVVDDDVDVDTDNDIDDNINDADVKISAVKSKKHDTVDDDNDDVIAEGIDAVNDVADADIDVEKISTFNAIQPRTNMQIHKNIVIIDPANRKTSNLITKTEMTEIISIRCAQISKHPKIYVDVDGLTNPIDMAKKEFNERKTPLRLRRKVGEIMDSLGKMTEYYEDWDVNTMARPFVYEIK